MQGPIRYRASLFLSSSLWVLCSLNQKDWILPYCTLELWCIYLLLFWCFPIKHCSQTELPNRFLANSICFWFNLPCCMTFKSSSSEIDSNSLWQSHFVHWHLRISNITGEKMTNNYFLRILFAIKLSSFEILLSYLSDTKYRERAHQSWMLKF